VATMRGSRTVAKAIAGCMLLLLLANCMVPAADAAKSKRSTKRGPDAFEEEIPGDYTAPEYDSEGTCVGENCPQNGGPDQYSEEYGGGGSRKRRMKASLWMRATCWC